MIEVNPYLDQLTNDTRQIIAFVKTEVMGLDEGQLSFKPDSKKWNILECIEHMNIATKHYVDIIQAKVPEAISRGQMPVKYCTRCRLMQCPLPKTGKLSQRSKPCPGLNPYWPMRRANRG